jgi:hypothetical protein
MTARRHRRIALRDDSGATLVLALIVVTVVALVVGAILGFSDTSLRATVQLRAQAGSAATADGAAQVAINALRRSPYDNDPASATYPNCFGTGGTAGTDENGQTLVLPNLVPDGTGGAANSAAVRCQPDPGSGPPGGAGSITAANKPRNAILTLSQNPAEDGLRIKALSPSIPFNVSGSIASDSNIAIPNGSLRSNASVSAHTGCTGTIDSNPAPVCTAGTTPDPGYAPETTTVPAHQTVPQNSSANCPGKVFSFQPGYYDDAAALSALMSGKGSGACKGSIWWFKPGIYYFDFQNSGSHQWLVRDGALIAGTPTDSSGNPVSRPTNPAAVPGACASPLHSTTARGVQFIFGGDSRLQLAGSADAEICGTYHADRPPIAIFGLASDTAAPTTLANASASTVTGPPGGFAPAPGGTLASGLGTSGDGATGTFEPGSEGGTATLALSGLLPAPGIPAGSTLSAAKLRLVFGTSTTATSRTLTVTPSSSAGAGSPITPSPAVSRSAQTAGTGGATQTFDLLADLQSTVHDRGLSDLTIDYSTQLPAGGKEQIDAVLLDLTYTAPALRGETTQAVPGNCLAAPYSGGSGGQCAVLSTQTSYKGHLAVQGTTYTPVAPIDLTLSNVTEQALRLGVIARTLWIKETGALRYSGPVIAIPDDSLGSGPDGTVVYLTVYVCAGSPTCKTPSSTLPAPPVGRESLRVRVYIHDPTGAPVAGSREMTVQAWVSRR